MTMKNLQAILVQRAVGSKQLAVEKSEVPLKPLNPKTTQQDF